MFREHYRVVGMTCAHCEQAVTREVSAIEGVRDVRVKLVPEGKSTVMVISDQPVTVDRIAEAVSEAGYTLVDQAVPARRQLPLAEADSTHSCQCCA